MVSLCLYNQIKLTETLKKFRVILIMTEADSYIVTDLLRVRKEIPPRYPGPTPNHYHFPLLYSFPIFNLKTQRASKSWLQDFCHSVHLPLSDHNAI